MAIIREAKGKNKLFVFLLIDYDEAHVLYRWFRKSWREI